MTNLQLVYDGQLVRCYAESSLGIMYYEWFRVEETPTEQLICDEVRKCLDLLPITGYVKALDNSVAVNYPIVPEAQEWIAEHIQKFAKEGLLCKYAIVMPEDFIAQLSNEQIIDETMHRQADKVLFEMKQFSNNQEALVWLLS